MDNKPIIKINFCDFSKGFDKHNNLFINLLKQKYTPEISDNPDFLFYSVFGKKHCSYTCTKIFYTGENIRPDFIACDYAFSFDYNPNPRNYRLPLYGIWGDINILTKEKNDVESILKSKTKFCCFVVSNPYCEERNEIFRLLSNYKKVDSGGRILNNIGGPVQDKLKFIADYKFVIAFENSSHPGYTTEKIFEAMLVNSIAIYWGDPLVHTEFNENSFINCHRFGSLQEVVKKVIELDTDDEKYKQFLKQSFLKNNQPNPNLNETAILERLSYIIDNKTNERGILSTRVRQLYCLGKYFLDLTIRTAQFKYYKYLKFRDVK